MLDVVVCALVLVVPALLYSIFLVKFQRKFTHHRNLQIALGAALFVTVCLFEIDMRLQGGWRTILKNRPTPMAANQHELVAQVLAVHICFAISAVVFWSVTLVHGLRNIPNPPTSSRYSGRHRILGWCSTISLTFTSITGLIFYYFAFVV